MNYLSSALVLAQVNSPFEENLVLVKCLKCGVDLKPGSEYLCAHCQSYGSKGSTRSSANDLLTAILDRQLASPACVAPTASAQAIPKDHKQTHQQLFGLHPDSPIQHTPLPEDLSAGSSSLEDSYHGPEPLTCEVPGYSVDRVLGHGGMGTVYLGKQLSLDRPVALKVMSKVWASDPVFVARFVREAYAAALLNHPNVVQIYDIGEVDGTRYFSMEYVDGRSLSDVLKASGRLDPETAVAYILQAARGLKHAHDRGIIHRDIKPDNLLLDQNGVVKVADLGLVKTPDLTRYQDRLAQDTLPGGESGLHTLPPDMTGVRMALGTPAYMAPEQCRDAASVDHKADIYSLGCSLYALVTGRQPFQANDSVGLMKKHAYEAPIPPETYTPRLPRELSAIILRMMAKHPGERFRNMGEVIQTLEQWLGCTEEKTKRFTPNERQVAEIEQLAKQYRSAPTAALKQRAISGFLAGCVLFSLLMLMFGKTSWAFGIGGMAIQAMLVYFLLNGWSRKTYLFKRVRQLSSGLSRGDWLVAAVGIGLFLAFLWLSKLLLVWAGFALMGTAAAILLWYWIDRKLAAERFTTIEATVNFSQNLRRQGVAPAEAQLALAKYSGREWEEFFEAIFGYEAKLKTREVLLRAGSAGKREKFAAWREPLLHLINYLEAERKKERDRRLLERAEYQRLLTIGLSKSQARQQATRVATELLEHADIVRDIAAEASLSGTSARVPQLQLSDVMRALPPEEKPSWANRILECLTGTVVRAVLAAFLLAACALWVFQNGLLRLENMRQGVESSALMIEGVAPEYTSWCDSANVGWGGMLLMASLFFRGQRMALLSLLGAGVAVLGHKFGIRTVEPIQDFHVAMMVGTLLALLGFRLGRR